MSSSGTGRMQEAPIEDAVFDKVVHTVIPGMRAAPD